MIAMETLQTKKKKKNKKNNQNTNTTAASEKEAYLRVLRNCHPGIDPSAHKSCPKMVKEKVEEEEPSNSFSSTGTCHLESVMDIAVQEVVAANALVAAMSNVNKNTITGCIASGSGLTREQKKNLQTVGHGEIITSKAGALRISEKADDGLQKKRTTPTDSQVKKDKDKGKVEDLKDDPDDRELRRLGRDLMKWAEKLTKDLGPPSPNDRRYGRFSGSGDTFKIHVRKFDRFSNGFARTIQHSDFEDLTPEDAS